MPFHLTTDGVMTAIPADSLDRANAIASRDEWETIAGRWPLKRLVAIWNPLPDVRPVEKFTSRQIALERIWRAVECPEKAEGKAQSKSEQTKTRFREGSKAAQVYALLCRPEGATLHEIQNLPADARPGNHGPLPNRNAFGSLLHNGRVIPFRGQRNRRDRGHLQDTGQGGEAL